MRSALPCEPGLVSGSTRGVALCPRALAEEWPDLKFKMNQKWFLQGSSTESESERPEHYSATDRSGGCVINSFCSMRGEWLLGPVPELS